MVDFEKDCFARERFKTELVSDSRVRTLKEGNFALEFEAIDEGDMSRGLRSA